MKKTAILALFLVATLLFACTGSLTEEQLTQKIIDANTNLKTYNIDMKILTTINTLVGTKPTTMKTDMAFTGQVDRQNRQMETQGTIKSQMLGFKTEADMSMVLVGDYMYTKIMDTWMKTKVEQKVWEQQDQVQSALALISSGKIERQDDATIGGNDYYVVLVKPDMKTLVAQALKEKESMLTTGMNFADIVRSYSSTLWINKDTFVIDRTVSDMELVMTPENMGKNTTNLTQEVKMTMHMEFAISKINEPVTITLPPEAGEAKEVKTTDNSITGNAIADVLKN